MSDDELIEDPVRPRLRPRPLDVHDHADNVHDHADKFDEGTVSDDPPPTSGSEKRSGKSVAGSA